MEKIKVEDIDYVLEKDINDCFNKEEFLNLVTDYFYDYDYILGDYAYDKLRLKGFCDKDNEKFSEINDIKNLDEYVENYCSYKASYYLLKKVK